MAIFFHRYIIIIYKYTKNCIVSRNIRVYFCEIGEYGHEINTRILLYFRTHKRIVFRCMSSLLQVLYNNFRKKKKEKKLLSKLLRVLLSLPIEHILQTLYVFITYFIESLAKYRFESSLQISRTQEPRYKN